MMDRIDEMVDKLMEDSPSPEKQCVTNQAEIEKEKAYNEAPSRLEAIKKTRELADSIVHVLYDMVSEENEDAEELKKLALTKKMMNGVNLWGAFSRLCEEKGLVDPGDIGIYEDKE
jgi:hypothetical protein